MLLRWLYRSRATVPARSVADGLIYLQSRDGNRRRGVTGYLHPEDGHYVQYLEGPPDGLAAIEDRIRRDWRHGEIGALLRGEIRVRRFSGWDMAFTGAATSLRATTGGDIAAASAEALLAFMDDAARRGAAQSVASRLPSWAA